MERLTKAHYNGNGYYMACSEECHSPADCIDCAALDKLVARLAAYEDTGLTPEEIVKMGMAWEDSKRYSGRLEGKLKAYEDAKAEGRILVLEKDDDPMSLDALALFLRNRADMTGELNEYDRMLMREASDRLAEAALKGGEDDG